MRFLAALLAAFAPTASAQNVPAPEKQYAALCAACHGEGANGGERGPALVNSRTLRNRSEEQIRNLIKNGTQGGMPGFKIPDDQ